MEMLPKLSGKVETSSKTAIRPWISRYKAYIRLPHVSQIWLEVASSATKSYRDVLSSRGGNPGATAVPTEGSLQPSTNFLSETSTVTGENSADEGFVTNCMKKRGNPSSTIPSGLLNPKRNLGLLWLELEAFHPYCAEKSENKALGEGGFPPDVVKSSKA
jgi:hypothetical protein